MCDCGSRNGCQEMGVLNVVRKVRISSCQLPGLQMINCNNDGALMRYTKRGYSGRDQSRCRMHDKGRRIGEEHAINMFEINF